MKQASIVVLGLLLLVLAIQSATATLQEAKIGPYTVSFDTVKSYDIERYPTGQDNEKTTFQLRAEPKDDVTHYVDVYIDEYMAPVDVSVNHQLGMIISYMNTELELGGNQLAQGSVGFSVPDIEGLPTAANKIVNKSDGSTFQYIASYSPDGFAGRGHIIVSIYSNWPDDKDTLDFLRNLKVVRAGGLT